MILQPNFARPWDMTTEYGHRLSLGLAPLQAIRCTMPACLCECFLPGKMQIRQCETCKHGWVPHALDKLGIRPTQHCWGPGPPFASGPVEPALPNTVFDVASLALYGCQALPIRLKILLDRLFSVLPPEDVLQVLANFGWTLEDYARGYMLQDLQGRPVENWTVCTREEEPLVLQQFLRFGETRAIATRILQQENDIKERDHRDQEKMKEESSDSAHNKAPKIDSDIKKFLEKTKSSTVPSITTTTTTSSSSLAVTAAMPPPGFNTLPSIPFPLIPGLSAPLPRFPLLPIPPASLPHIRLPTSGLPTHPLSPPMTSSIPMSIAQSPLGRLQGMQPFDFRKERESRSPEAASHRSQPMRPPSPKIHSTAATSVTFTTNSLASGLNPGSPLCLTKTSTALPMLNNPTSGINTPAAPPSSRSRSRSASSSSELDWDDDDDDDMYENNSQNALNLTQDRNKDGDSKRYVDREVQRPLPEISDSLSDADKRLHLRKPNSPVKRSWNPLGPLGTQLINPATGKKRVQCNVCLKTFCDKGALKIHFSAVHLREMHKCTVEGCNMMFSSRRSRNRHSANPNPKLHSPHLRRKISPHDGRTSQPHPLLLSQSLGLTPPMPFPPGLHPMGSLPLMPMHQDVNPTLSLNASHPENPADRVLGETARSANHSVSSMSSGGGDTPVDRHGNGVESKRRGYYASTDGEEDDDDRLSQTSNDGEDEINTENHSTGHPLSSPKGVRKRKSQNPTRLLQPDNEDRNFLSSDDDPEHNREVAESVNENKRCKSESNEADKTEAMPKNGLPSAETSAPPQQHEVARYKSGVDLDEQDKLKNHLNDDLKTLRLEKSASSDDYLDTSNVLRHLEHLSQGSFNEFASRVVNSHSYPFGLPKPETDDVVSENDSSSPASPLSDSHSTSSTLTASIFGSFDVPIDKDNPRRCAACGKIFQNHFGVKTHYQNVHLKLMHKCTVDGCQAAFPSKRSRDRHSANLNLHRKLLSTTSGSIPDSTSPASPDNKTATDLFSAIANNANLLRDEFLSRIYANAEAHSMIGFGLSQFLQPPPSLFMPGLGLNSTVPFLNHVTHRHLNNNEINGKNSMETASPPPSSPSDRVSPSLSDSSPSMICHFCRRSFSDSVTLQEHYEENHLHEMHRCNVNGCTKMFISSKKKNVHCQDDHGDIRNSV